MDDYTSKFENLDEIHIFWEKTIKTPFAQKKKKKKKAGARCF